MRLDRRCRSRSSSFCCSDLNFSTRITRNWSTSFGPSHLARPNAKSTEGPPTINRFSSQVHMKVQSTSEKTRSEIDLPESVALPPVTGEVSPPLRRAIQRLLQSSHL